MTTSKLGKASSVWLRSYPTFTSYSGVLERVVEEVADKASEEDHEARNQDALDALALAVTNLREA